MRMDRAASGREDGYRIGKIFQCGHRTAEGTRNHGALFGLGHILEPDAVFPPELQNCPQSLHAHFFPDPFIGQAAQIESGPGTFVIEF